MSCVKSQNSKILYKSNYFMLVGAKGRCSVAVCIAWCCVELEVRGKGKDHYTVVR